MLTMKCKFLDFERSDWAEKWGVAPFGEELAELLEE